jgi:hypothetical protein
LPEGERRLSRKNEEETLQKRKHCAAIERGTLRPSKPATRGRVRENRNNSAMTHAHKKKTTE